MVSRCCGGLTTATLNVEDAGSCGRSRSAGANFTDHAHIPSVTGASNVISPQYSALVPGSGVAPSRPRATTISASSHTSIVRPVSAAPAEDFAPTLISNFSPITTGEGIAHTARLVAWG